MVLKTFDNSLLDGLCSRDQLDLLDSVDRLRSQGIDHYVSLPQIIVCGDQSSGKSSVLEAISGVSFPVKSNLCTRFPTELILRKTPTVGVSVSIVPHHSHSESERASLSSFHETLDGFDALPALIESAKTAMAIGSFGRAFSKNLLRIEVSGPDRPHLTIVDLPGLIHSETKQQSAADIELVQDVVKSYMDESRSIILAVVSAKNDYANQIVLKLARIADKTGTRTLGVITKPDTLIPGSDSEAMYIALAQNLDVDFRLGWHVLKNMDSETGSGSLRNRDEKERHFFSAGMWTMLPDSILGIVPLRGRLSKLLLAQIAAELPSLINEIEVKTTACRTQLQKLGQPRVNIEEQRLYLLTLSQVFQSVTKAAVDGTYNDPFFGDAKTDTGYQKRIRAIIQNLNQSFAEVIAREGHRYTISDLSSEAPNTRISEVETFTRVRFLDRIEDLMKRTRSRELPGTFNPMIVSDLFVEQSQPWEALVRSHIEEVARAVKTFLRHIISYIADASTCGMIFQKLVEPTFEDMMKDLKRKTADLLSAHQSGHPITYNHYFTEAVQKVKQERSRAEFTRVIQDFFGVESLHPSGSHHYVAMDYRPLLEALVARIGSNMNQYACSEALDCMQAYYKVALKRFVDDIAVEAIETKIMARLRDILSPIKVTYLAADVVKGVAGEPEESQARRKKLQKQLDVLTQGSETCKRFIVGRLEGIHDVTISSGSFRNSSPVLPSVSNHTSSDGLADHQELEQFRISTSEVYGELMQAPEPADMGYVLDTVNEPIEENMAGGVKMSKKKAKKSKKWKAPCPSEESPSGDPPQEPVEYVLKDEF